MKPFLGVSVRIEVPVPGLHPCPRQVEGEAERALPQVKAPGGFFSDATFERPTQLGLGVAEEPLARVLELGPVPRRASERHALGGAHDERRRHLAIEPIGQHPFGEHARLDKIRVAQPVRLRHHEHERRRQPRVERLGVGGHPGGARGPGQFGQPSERAVVHLHRRFFE